MSVGLRHLVLGSMLFGSLAPTSSCKHGGETRESRGTDRPGKDRLGPRLPEPFPLPAEPMAVIHVTAPGKILAEARGYSDRIPPEPEVAAGLLRGIERDALETNLAGAVAFDRAWNLVHTSGETIVAVPIRREKIEAVAALLERLPAEGGFGAVALPPVDATSQEREAGGLGRESPPVVAWLDRKSGTLYFAKTLRGLATGPRLEEAYGRHPIRFGLGKTAGDLTGDDFPFERIEITGAGLSSFEARVRGLDRQQVPTIGELSNGALTGMLSTPQVAWGVSTRWSGHAEAVDTIITEATLQVRDQNFLIRGVLEDLLRKANAVLRSWNGRVMLGSGPANHVLVALGTDDTARAERAVLHLTRSVLDNLKLADTFGLQVPKLSLQKNAGSAGEFHVHQITLGDARGMIPGELAPLLDGGRLRVAVAFPPHAGAALIVAGPDPVAAAVRWVEESAASTREHPGLDDLAAASFAVTPEALRPVVEAGSPLGAISVSADRPPTLATLRQEGDALVLRVRPISGEP